MPAVDHFNGLLLRRLVILPRGRCPRRNIIPVRPRRGGARLPRGRRRRDPLPGRILRRPGPYLNPPWTARPPPRPSRGSRWPVPHRPPRAAGKRRPPPLSAETPYPSPPLRPRLPERCFRVHFRFSSDGVRLRFDRRGIYHLRRRFEGQGHLHPPLGRLKDALLRAPRRLVVHPSW